MLLVKEFVWLRGDARGHEIDDYELLYRSVLQLGDDDREDEEEHQPFMEALQQHEIREMQNVLLVFFINGGGGLRRDEFLGRLLAWYRQELPDFAKVLEVDRSMRALARAAQPKQQLSERRALTKQRENWATALNALRDAKIVSDDRHEELVAMLKAGKFVPTEALVQGGINSAARPQFDNLDAKLRQSLKKRLQTTLQQALLDARERDAEVARAHEQSESVALDTLVDLGVLPAAQRPASTRDIIPATVHEWAKRLPAILGGAPRANAVAALKTLEVAAEKRRRARDHAAASERTRIQNDAARQTAADIKRARQPIIAATAMYACTLVHSAGSAGLAKAQLVKAAEDALGIVEKWKAARAAAAALASRAPPGAQAPARATPPRPRPRPTRTPTPPPPTPPSKRRAQKPAAMPTTTTATRSTGRARATSTGTRSRRR